MTHIYAYIKEGYSKEQIRAAVAAMKNAAGEGLHLRAESSTVAVKEVAAENATENLGVFALVYTAKGQGYDRKSDFTKRMDAGLKAALGETTQTFIVIKEQANDMGGLNGLMHCAAYN